MSASSTFFAQLFSDNCHEPSPVIVLPQEVKSADFALLLKFMYQGQVDIPREDLDQVLAAAEILKIKGLTNPDEEVTRQVVSPSKRKRKSGPTIRFIHQNSEGKPLEVELAVSYQVIFSDSWSQRYQIVFTFQQPQRFQTFPEEEPESSDLMKYDFFPGRHGSKSYTSQDMDLALESLRDQRLSLTRASEIYKIPATTLWQRANKMGIATPKKESVNKTWSDNDLNIALGALRRKEISANKASKLYGIPSSVSH